MLIHKLLPIAREVGVSLELRGWNWHQPPLKPYYDVKIPMYAICSKFCPTGRDVFLSQVKGKKPILNSNVSLGKILHGAVSDSLLNFIKGEKIEFEDWWSKIKWEGLVGDRESFKRKAKIVWDYVVNACKAKYIHSSTEQPFASKHDLIASSIPFLIEHKISGELLGSSGYISFDCYDYLRCIMFDLKVEAKPEEWYRLFPVGYALVFESIYEVPIDICCVVYLNFIGDRLVIKKDLFFANDELRSWWIEERDKKLEIVAQGREPIMPKKCDQSCIYYHACREDQK